MNLPKPNIGLRQQQLLQEGKYCLTKVVGQGGFGITYQGIWYTEVKGSLGTMQTEVPVCIKEYYFKDYCYRDTDGKSVRVHSDTGKELFGKFKEKLIKEAKILSEVQHPYIVNVLEVFEENNTAYIVMEYIEGCSIKYMMDKKGLLPEQKVLKYVHQIGEALSFVHKKHILHLDIKPSNILIDKQDNARLIDFGVSRRYDIERQETSTVILTLSKGFASIEQYDDEGIQKFTPCPDIYSLGATMYNILTGKVPTESILRATRPLINPKVLNEQLSEKTEAVILKAMEIVAADRYQTVRSMMKSLDKPPKEENAENELREETTFSNNEDTLVRTIVPEPSDEDGDETVVKEKGHSEGFSTDESPKRRRSIIKLSLLFVCLIGIATGIYFFALPENKVILDTEIADGNENNSDLYSENLPEVAADTLTEQTEPEQPKPLDIQENDQPEVSETPKVDEPIAEKEIDVPPKTTQTETTQPKEDEEKVPESAEEKVDTKALYDSLLVDGKANMAANKVSEAEKNFAQAKALFLTEEVVRLQIALESKKDELRIAQYEIKMNLGLFQIVRKKSTQKYGAIDARGMETIPCKYLSVGKSDAGRAFEREDNLFDIYNEEGVLITAGQAYY